MRHPPKSMARRMQPGTSIRRALLGSLSRRLRWSYALVSVIPLTILGIVLIAFSLHQQRQSVTQEQQTTANWVARELHAAVSVVDEHLLTLGQELGPHRSSAELLDAIAVLRTAVPDISDVAVLDETGKERMHVSQLRGFFGSELIDRSTDPLVRWTLQTGRVAQGPISQEHNGVLIYPSYAPIFSDSGQVVGVIRAEVRIDRITRTLRAKPLTAGSIVYVVDNTGRVLFATNDAPPVAPPALSWLLGGQASSAEYRNSTGTQVVGAWSPIPVQPDRWWAVVEFPSTLAYAPIWHVSLLLVSVVGLVILTTIGWGLYQTRVVLRPLEELRAGAAMIGTGDLAARIPIHDIDEIGALAEEFNRMAEHLQVSRARIEQQNEHLREGLTLARDIQLGLLPSALPREMPPLVLRAYANPAYEVGGDFYTYIPLDDQRLAIAIGDISGKGVGAALMMALTLTTIEAQGRALDRPEQLLRAVNQQLSERLIANRMNAALLYTVIDMQQGTLTMANAGMIPPYLLRDGQVQMLDTRGFLLGPLPDMEYQATTIDLLPGDLLLLVSDGVIEARRPDGELFGFRRVEQFLRDYNAQLPPDRLIESLLDQVDRFVDGAEQQDDVTIIVVQPNLSPVTISRALDHAREVRV